MTALLVRVFVFHAALAHEPDGLVIATTKLRDGVFVCNEGFIFDVLELKDGHFRRCIRTHMDSGPFGYRSSGDYVFEGETVILKEPNKADRILTFRTLNGELTLWRSTAIDRYKQTLTPDPFGRGILHHTTKTAEEASGGRIQGNPQ